MDAKVIRHNDAYHRHDDDGNKRAWHFLADEWGAGNDDDRQDAHDGCRKVNGVEILDVTNPLLDEVGRYSPFDMESQQVFHLCGEDGQGKSRMRKSPAITVAIANPVSPYCWMMP